MVAPDRQSGMQFLRTQPFAQSAEADCCPGRLFSDKVVQTTTTMKTRLFLRSCRSCWLLPLLLTSCMTTHVMTEPDSDTPANVSYTDTTLTAYFWGLKQPVDLIPPCDPRFNHLNGVTVRSTFGHYLLLTLTLGIVHKQRVAWACAPYVPPPEPIGQLNNR